MKKIILLLKLFIAILFIAIGSTAEQCENETIISGKVYLDNDTNPVENVTVIAWVNVEVEVYPGIFVDIPYYLGANITNSTGDYSISLNLSYSPFDRVYLEVHKYGALKNETGEFSVACGDTIYKNINYTTCSYIRPLITGYVKHNGAFINENINITMYIDGFLADNQTLSDPTGKYELNLSTSLITGLSSNLTVVAESDSFRGSRSAIRNDLCVLSPPENYDYNINVSSKRDFNHDGIIIHDWDDLMFAYKCFLGINKNCDTINYQDWTSMKEKYNYFVNNQ